MPADQETAVREVLEASTSRVRNEKRFIGDFVAADSRRKDIFKDVFQTPGGWNEFFEGNLSGSPTDQLSKPDATWSPKSFQALFTAAWAHHPTEKGGYMINLSGLDEAQQSAVQRAFAEHCSPRPSSHLDKAGGSAAEGYRFLKGYKELLVHMPTIQGQRYLYLKTEGHKLDAKGFLAHMASWGVKAVTGHGMTASKPLHELAKSDSDLVEPRAAENYSKPYGRLLKELGLNGTQVTVHQMAEKLLGDGVETGAGQQISELTNNELGERLRQVLANPAEHQLLQRKEFVDELQDLAERLLNDNPGQTGRVFHEVIATPAQLDEAVSRFQQLQQ
ncbi:hypothetical protein OOT46_17760 [Aquabacterium sp. A7-Y]|uniref:hypothetical protein n=1 Tax=Aquabacterium sp. A7-Y TaxID=1349605 RepID=UPI00223D0DFF|nr:hypothetical protein [Aquabacterium sp. A7-Y]MCW7539687.1 hypothetical protein [Aquabacterium sp. A7-Y]